MTSQSEQEQQAWEKAKAVKEAARQRAQEEILRLIGNAPTKAKVAKKFGKTTATWKMFESWFFLPGDQYPQYLRGFTKGQAINLTQGLNRCNIQHAEEQGMPDEVIMFSAKAKAEEEGELWYVEISKNYKRAGEAAPSKHGGNSSAWLESRLTEVPAVQGPQPISEDEWRKQHEEKARQKEQEAYAQFGIAPTPRTPQPEQEQPGFGRALLDSIAEGTPKGADPQEDLLAGLYGIEGGKKGEPS